MQLHSICSAITKAMKYFRSLKLFWKWCLQSGWCLLSSGLTIERVRYALSTNRVFINHDIRSDLIFTNNTIAKSEENSLIFDESAPSGGLIGTNYLISTCHCDLFKIIENTEHHSEYIQNTFYGYLIQSLQCRLVIDRNSNF